MRSLFIATLLSLCVAATAFAEGPAACDSINAARRSGAPVSEIAQRFDTTRARVAACGRVARQRAAADSQRARVEAARAERSLAH